MSARKRRAQINPEDDFDIPSMPLSDADAALFGEIAKVDNQLASIASDGSIQIGAFVLTTRGLVVNGSISYEEWQDIGALLRRLDASIQWLIGDWMAYGERIWGQTYEQVGEQTGYAYQTLRDYAWVAANVDLSIRIDKLSFSHHRLVASLPPEGQRYWLTQALEQGWSISQMRSEIHGDPPTLPGDLDRFARFLARNRTRYDRFGKKFARMGQGEKRQISQMLDDEIAHLQRLKQALR